MQANDNNQQKLLEIVRPSLIFRAMWINYILIDMCKWIHAISHLYLGLVTLLQQNELWLVRLNENKIKSYVAKHIIFYYSNSEMSLIHIYSMDKHL